MFAIMCAKQKPRKKVKNEKGKTHMAMSPEQKKAATERMKAYHAAKKAAKAAGASTPKDNSSVEQVQPEPNLNDLVRHVKELQAQLEALRSQPQQAVQPMSQMAPNGQLVGTFEKYVIDPKHYPDPRERLSVEPRLQRFAFRDNYELEFEITSTFYETIDHIKTREPKFTLSLIRIVYDEETGEPTNGRYTVCRAVFHEDPQAAIVIARENGVDVDETNQKFFLDEMRYLRMRDWLLEAFYPPKPIQPKTNKREVVIGNKLVEYFEINSENSEQIPFANLKSKL